MTTKAKMFPHWFTTRERGWDPRTRTHCEIYEKEPDDWRWVVYRSGELTFASGKARTQGGARRAARAAALKRTAPRE